jgi:hypothetical protein
MKQEHRLVAEIYRFVAPFIDTTKEIYLSLDGQAAKTAVGTGRFIDPDIPDLWFTLVGFGEPTRIEAKILDKGSAQLMQSQILAWRSSGPGSYKPASWVAANREFTEFYYWSHSSFVPSLDRCAAARKTHKLAAPKDRLAFSSIPELALHILRMGPNNSFKPIPHRGVGHVPTLR